MNGNRGETQHKHETRNGNMRRRKAKSGHILTSWTIGCRAKDTLAAHQDVAIEEALNDRLAEFSDKCKAGGDVESCGPTT